MSALRRSSCCLVAALQCTTTHHKRFTPPWEREGKTAEEFFGGVMTSSNPVQQHRRDAARAEKYMEVAAVEEAVAPEDARRAEEMERHREEVQHARHSFLPYGAVPKEYVPETQMAAWGEYAAQLAAAPQSTFTAAGTPSPSSGASSSSATQYSEETRRALLNDMNSKIPYRYTAPVPMPSNGEPRWPLHGTAGVVMDVDGVIYRSHKLIPGADTAVQTMKTLEIPFVFMTNSGSLSEADKAAELSRVLGTYIDPSQVLLSHSPMRLLAPRYARSRVLVVGPPRCADILRSYGFAGAVPILEFQADHPEMLPYKKWEREPVVKPRRPPADPLPFPTVEAVFQLHDPDDPFNDIQTILDVLTSYRGRVGSAVTGTQSVPYYASADDLLWASEAPLPRLGQGAFREMISSVYESVTGRGLQVTLFGKPRAIAYRYAEQRLRTVTAALGWDPSRLRAVFMVGDNTETDILGANAALAPWASVHVLSGVGSAPAARRTLSEGDDECEWLETCVSKTPHYVAPTLDHFVRELLAFPETAVLQNRMPFYGRQNPATLKETYNFTT